MKTNQDLVTEAELEIDNAFSDNKLKDIGYAQAVWTLLSVVEDLFLKICRTRNNEKVSMFADGLINSLSHPIRECHKKASGKQNAIKKLLINEHYELAHNWLETSVHYNSFCTIFPLWHRNKIDISICGDELLTNDWQKLDLRYEAYNRVFRKDGKEREILLNPDKILALIQTKVTVTEDTFRVNFNPSLVAKLVKELEPCTRENYTLPENWKLSSFTFGDFSSIFITIQSMLCAWHVAKTACANSGMPALGYSSSVWLPNKDELKARLVRYTGLEKQVVSDILKMLTFGKCGIENPDIALQPIIDLENNLYALSPFVWLNSNAERNLCALINQIDKEKSIYLELTNKKEGLLRKEIEDYLKPLSYEIKFGAIKGTDVDVAIIDRKNSVCLCLELKWFIEVAEVREGHDRSQELRKGIDQAKLINKLFQDGDSKLINTVLNLDGQFDFLAAVGSRNWIGDIDVQDDDVPIIKVWHLLETIKTKGSLTETLSWLRNRDYLPVQDQDYRISPVKRYCGKWRTTWYGIDTTVQ